MITQSLVRATAKNLQRHTKEVRLLSSSAGASHFNAEDGSVHKAAAALLLAAMGGGYAVSDKNSKTTACDKEASSKTQKMLGNSLTLKAGGIIDSSSVEVRKTTGKGHSQLPVFTAYEVAQNNGENGKPVWMSYGGNVYDVTDFINNHPGGSEKIMQAAGSVRGKK